MHLEKLISLFALNLQNLGKGCVCMCVYVVVVVVIVAVVFVLMWGCKWGQGNEGKKNKPWLGRAKRGCHHSAAPIQHLLF